MKLFFFNLIIFSKLTYLSFFLGSAFISSGQQYNPQPTGPPKQPPGSQGPPNRVGGPNSAPPPVGNGGRWGDHDTRYDPRRVGGPIAHGGPGDIGPRGRFDGPGGPGGDTGPRGRFDGPPGRGPKTRFNDSDRFGSSVPIPPPPPPPQSQANDDSSHSRFGPPLQSQNDLYRSTGRDEFGRDLRKDDSRFGTQREIPSGRPSGGRGIGDKERDTYRDRPDPRDRSSDHDKDNDSRDKDQQRGMISRNDRSDRNRRDRERERDRGNRVRSSRSDSDKKRSISPASVASSSGGGVRGDSRSSLSGSNKRRYEPCNIPKNLILRFVMFLYLYVF